MRQAGIGDTNMLFNLNETYRASGTDQVEYTDEICRVWEQVKLRKKVPLELSIISKYV